MQRLCVLVALLAAGSAHAGDDGFKPLFNGKDLTGWHNVNCAPGTFFVKENMIITTGKPTGYLRTDKQYENFVAEFEWFHAPSPKGSVGNSGFFVWCDPLPALGTGYTRGIEVQVLVNLTYKDKKGNITASSQGDLFSIHGARCKPDRPHPSGSERCLPSENHCKGEFEWNHYKVVGNNGVLKLTVNGHEVSGVYECNPRKGYLALESEGSECRFKNLKIKELPSTNPKPNEICEVDKGFKSLFTGLDLTGWKASDEQKAHWKMNDGVLSYDGKGTAKDPNLWSEESYGNFELVLDWKSNSTASGIFVRGQAGDGDGNIKLNADKKASWRSVWNRSVIRMKGNRLTVRTNGKAIIDDAQVAAVPASGPIALVHRGDAVQFRNVFIRELKKGE